MTEKQYENKIKKYLEDNGVWFVKYWGGGHFTKAGIPDLICCVNGKFLAIEVKAESGKVSELQKMNLRKITEAGGFALTSKPSEWDELRGLICEIKSQQD